MATASLTPNMTTLSDCETTTGWTGTTLTQDTEVLVQGTASVSCEVRNPGLSEVYYSISATNLTATHIRLWFNYAAIGFLNTFANGGIRIMLRDSSNSVAYYYVGGIDTYGGGWQLATIYTSNTPDSGSVNLASVTQVGIAFNLTARPRKAINTWLDKLAYGSGISYYGGTSGDPITMADIYDADSAAGWGVVRRINGVYFVSSAITIGSSSGSTYFDDSNQVIIFEDQPVSSTLYNLTVSGSSGVTFNLADSVIKSASPARRVTIDSSAGNVTASTFTGNTVQNANTVTFKSGQTITSNVFRGCNQIIPNDSTFTDNTVSNGASSSIGALLWASTGISSCAFTNNPYAIGISSGTSLTFDALSFSGNTVDVLNTTANAVTIAATNGSNPSTVNNTGGGSVTIVNSKALTITNLIEASEVRIYRASDMVELAGVENIYGLGSDETVNATTASDPNNAGRYKLTYNYSYAGDVPIIITVVSLDYLPIRLDDTLGANDFSVKIIQSVDRQFINP